ncbi:hypothetical protein T265_07923 [Opisthorchis viverrini]|uniref:Uncharacterized protein n=1 Tax=Opisthorchis viverrini TaxID=6198 RepID=A0A074ZM14_OPIVI|nr:hypothetical protein T265_07923 [Opisthorchis viverrini]KER24410.1 hypothetical protein T265_07923 [Opisthorchis viverrini]
MITPKQFMGAERACIHGQLTQARVEGLISGAIFSNFTKAFDRSHTSRYTTNASPMGFRRNILSAGFSMRIRERPSCRNPTRLSGSAEISTGFHITDIGHAISPKESFHVIHRVPEGLSVSTKRRGLTTDDAVEIRLRYLVPRCQNRFVRTLSHVTRINRPNHPLNCLTVSNQVRRGVRRQPISCA